MASEQVMQVLSVSLSNTLSPDLNVRNAAESALKQMEGTPQFPTMLLHLVAGETVPSDTRVAAAVHFKNFIMHNWKMEEPGNPGKISIDDRNAVKQSIVFLMLQVPARLQQQLTEAVSIIGQSDFPDQWPELLPTLVQKLDTSDFNVINGVLQTANRLFKKYTYEFKSNRLYTEIQYSLDNFAEPLTQMTEKILVALSTMNDKGTLLVLMTLLNEIMEIFFSLNFQDFPAYFEDNLAKWMNIMHTVLIYENPLVKSEDEDRPGPLEKTKAQICQNIVLYSTRYDDEDTEIKNHIPTFVQDVWTLLVTTGKEGRDDYLVSGAMHFLSSVAAQVRTAQIFGQEGILSTICERIIIPNMELRDEDIDCFKSDPEEYMRRDIEGSDTETRRRAACDLVRALRVHYQAQVTEIFTAYVKAMLQKHSENPKANWKSKDAAIFLVTSLTVTGSVQALGTTKTNELVDINDFYTSYILADLQNPSINSMPVLKADAIKYLLTFRNQLPREALANAIPVLIQHIGAKSLVQLSYAANSLERMLAIKDATGVNGKDAKLKVGADDLQPHLEAALTVLFGALQRESSSQSQYIMRAIMRVIVVAQQRIMPYLSTIMQQLTAKLLEVSKNPSKPDFNHYLFESIGAAVRFGAPNMPGAVEAFEQSLFPSFQLVLQQDVVEFMPYVFQIMAQLLESRQPPLPDQYKAWLPHLLMPVLWEKEGNIPALARLVEAYVRIGGDVIGSDPTTMNALLGVFQKLISTMAHDHQGLAVLGYIVCFVPKQFFDAYAKPVYVLLFQRLQASKTPKYMRSLVVFMALHLTKHGPDAVIATIDSIQPQLFGMVITSLFVPETQKVVGAISRKTCGVGLAQLLTKSETVLGSYGQHWPRLLEALVKLFELPQEVDEDNDVFVDIQPPSAYENRYARLTFSGKPDYDPFADIVNPKIYLAACLSELSAKRPPGEVQSMIKLAGEETLQHVAAYCLQAGVNV